MALIVIGVIFLVVGGLFLLGRRSSLSGLRQVQMAETAGIGDLQESASAVASELGAGAFSQVVELRGIVECDEPLVGELSETDCVYYTVSVDHSYEGPTAPQTQQIGQQPAVMPPLQVGSQPAVKTPIQAMGKVPQQPVYPPQQKAALMPPGSMAGRPGVQGMAQTPLQVSGSGRAVQTGRRSERIVSRSKRCPFTLRDASGAIEVDPEGAEIEAKELLKTFESEEALTAEDPLHLRYGSFSHPRPKSMAKGQITLGYELEERGLPTGSQVYVLGEVNDSDGRLMMRRPSDSSHKFVITTRSKEALVRSLRGKVKTRGVVSAVTLALGAVLLVIGLILTLTG
ncbi:MAG: hypothetical protein JW797_10150 [Bradymonadales bacterium]|nr:hypothetical protein [Bradymonadales bacterium]